MSDVTTIEVMTNTTPNSCVSVHCDCATLWSLAQQFCYLRLSNKNSSGQYRLIDYFPARARRIAATYARFYLEQEEHGDPAKKGRYYWMALGAFASKTVACSLESIQLSQRLFGSTVRNGLGQGNFWLFMDIAAWHWYYNTSPESFDQCIDQRNTDTYADKAKAQVKLLPWAEESLPKIDHLRVKQEVKEGFAKVKVIEGAPKGPMRQNKQFDNLMAMARHEQGNILQKLIYDTEKFAWWVQVQRNDSSLGFFSKTFATATSLFSPKLKVSYVSVCDTDLPEYSNVAPENTKLEDYFSRMQWIGQVATQFHGLMINQPQRMEAELASIAGWVDQPDFIKYPDEVRAR